MSSTKLNILTLGPRGLEALVTSWGEPKFRYQQIFQWLWKDGAKSFAEMTNVSKTLRERLESEYEIRYPRVEREQKSTDGTIKFLLALDDGKTVETVWIPRADQDRVTLCVSSQVGCKMACAFCMTAQQKVERNLTAGEIAMQVLAMPDRDKITNVVLMGMGEPFDNYEPVMEALELMTDVKGFNLGPRKITVSTSGLLPKMEKFFKETRVRLALSLNAPNNEIRSKIMPVNKAYPVEALIEAIKKNARETTDKNFFVTIEYILMKGVNDSLDNARELAKLLRGVPCKVNLLLYNENPSLPFLRPTMNDIEGFRQVLGRNGLLNFIRTSRGRDIAAACGQLASEHVRDRVAPGQINPILAAKTPAQELRVSL